MVTEIVESETSPVLAGLFMVALPTSAAAWVLLIRRALRERKVVDWSPRLPVPWGLAQILLVAVAYLVLQGVAAGVLGLQAEEISAEALLVMAGTSLLTLAVAIAVMRSTYAATPADLGLSTRHLGQDLLTGAIATVAVVPPIYVLQGTLHYLLHDLLPETHPLIDSFKEHQNLRMAIAMVVTAVIVAPVVEEFFFRGLLQGWLEKVWLAPTNPATLLEQPPLCEPVMTEVVSIASPPSLPARLGPIVISSLIFAAVHYNHGTAPITLAFFALALGYLYQQTHRLWPCIVLHMALNASSILMLFLGLEE